MLSNLLCASNGALIAIYIVDAIIILAAAAWFIWYYVRSAKKKNTEEVDDEEVVQLDEDTFVLQGEKLPEEQAEPVEEDDTPFRLVNQIKDISEPVNEELSSNTVVVKHEVEQVAPKALKKEEIENFVIIDGKQKVKTKKEQKAAVNRGQDAFKNATNFVNVIKTQQSDEAPKTTPATAKPAKTTTTRAKTTKTSKKSK